MASLLTCSGFDKVNLLNITADNVHVQGFVNITGAFPCAVVRILRDFGKLGYNFTNYTDLLGDSLPQTLLETAVATVTDANITSRSLKNYAS